MKWDLPRNPAYFNSPRSSRTASPSPSRNTAERPCSSSIRRVNAGSPPQYKGLEELWKKYKDKGLVVLGFPCNQFGNQEPGSDAEIATFCERNFGVTFPLFSKVDVNGPAAHPLFTYLKSQSRGLLWTSRIKWNFTKFLVSPDGNPIRRYAPTTPPQRLERDIEKLLGR